MPMMIKFMNMEEVKKEKSYREVLLEHYRKHNLHGCFDDLIAECQERINLCDERIKELGSTDSD